MARTATEAANKNVQISSVMRAVPVPPPVLSKSREAQLSVRQREILDALGTIFASGFIDLTMSDLAQQINCSLRTLYLLANNRNELVAMVIDRTLRNHGRSANGAAESASSALDALQRYLHAANDAVSRVTPAFAADMAAIGEGIALNDAHNQYLIDVTKALLDLAISSNEMAAVDTVALARMLGGLGRDFSRPDVLETLTSTPAQSANAMVDLILDAVKGTR